MRTKIVAGNWKMNKNSEETEDLLNELIDKLPLDKEVQIVVAPTFVNLASAVDHLEFTNISVAAQNMHQAENGAYTGEISADMLKSVGVNTVILGHSERRAIFHETDAMIANKVDTALKHDMTVIFCFGEELKDRQNNQHFNVVENQLRDGLFHLEKDAFATTPVLTHLGLFNFEATSIRADHIGRSEIENFGYWGRWVHRVRRCARTCESRARRCGCRYVLGSAVFQ